MGAQLLNEPQPGCELQACSPWGPIRLSMSWGQMADAQGLIQQLSHWAGTPLAFLDSPWPLSADPGELVATVCDARLAPVGTRIAIPRGLLKETTPPLLLQGAAIKWPTLSFQVLLATLTDSAVEPSHVQDGGLTLLPHAFQSPWVVHLIQEQTGCMMIGHLRVDPGVVQLRQRLSAPESPAQADLVTPDEWAVFLARPLVMDLPTAMGWVPGADTIALDYSCDGLSASDFGLSVRLVHRSKGLQLSGLVVPVMMGAALRLTPVSTFF